jgi:hypothetical protein
MKKSRFSVEPLTLLLHSARYQDRLCDLRRTSAPGVAVLGRALAVGTTPGEPECRGFAALR